MILLFDVGNSNIGFAIYEERAGLIKKWRIRTKLDRTSDEYAMIIDNMIKDYDINHIVIGSVVPIITDLLIDFSEAYHNIKPLVIGPGVKTGLDIKLNNPKEIGADLVATAVGALSGHSGPLIVIDLGTATKLTYVENNTFYGGLVTPGVETSLHGLVNNTALLPHIEMKAPKRVVCRGTVTAMQSGIVYGTASMIDGLIEKIETEQGQNCTLVATGGLSKYIIPHCKRDITLDQDLIFKGLIEIYHKNQ
ncbi:type III pantothenate kinase [Haloplasma contractile]|uniref:Type III pantothenate kinase n=1 Tax=Haloplasma contractile SSD-17B TaxID=1033810 RepID=U2DSS8_9MOLU|nr:type III pantothenate kinase [Haloplasma contractile]ERJ11547.1 Type III pantothenate kinase protein [Haloplasma contractile SSD-17B]